MLGVDPEQVEAEPGSDAAVTLAFIREHWSRSVDVPGGWECDALDADTGLCTVQGAKPPVCVGYPWYGRAPEPWRVYHGRCSYLLDVPPSERPAGARPLIPIVDVSRRRL